MGWASAVLRWLSFGRLGAASATDPVLRAYVPGTDRTRVEVAGTGRAPAYVPGTDRTRVTTPAN